VRDAMKKKLLRVAGLAILIGTFMRIFDHPDGTNVLLGAFAFYFLIKIAFLVSIRFVLWTRLHFVNLILLIAAFFALYMKYMRMEYSSLIFGIVLLAESIVSAIIAFKGLLGADNLNILRTILKRLR